MSQRNEHRKFSANTARMHLPVHVSDVARVDRRNLDLHQHFSLRGNWPWQLFDLQFVERASMGFAYATAAGAPNPIQSALNPSVPIFAKPSPFCEKAEALRF
jgi:hypothetical protein